MSIEEEGRRDVSRDGVGMDGGGNGMVTGEIEGGHTGTPLRVHENEMRVDEKGGMKRGEG